MSDPGDGQPSGERHAAEQDLRATADSVRDALQRLDHIEAEKSRLAPDDPRTDELAEEAVELAERIRHETLLERQLGRELG